jgi:hypothetical protein
MVRFGSYNTKNGISLCIQISPEARCIIRADGSCLSLVNSLLFKNFYEHGRHHALCTLRCVPADSLASESNALSEKTSLHFYIYTSYRKYMRCVLAARVSDCDDQKVWSRWLDACEESESGRSICKKFNGHKWLDWTIFLFNMKQPYGTRWLK